jgi:GntR family transcriptional regulator, transcriptional repressor for pyruvate dehydrogenase complex
MTAERRKFKPVKLRRASEEVINQLKEEIRDGYLKPGDKLPPERQLSEEFKVSRLTIREALRVLESSGLVITQQGSTGGKFVADLTYESLSRQFLDLFFADKISITEIHRVRVLLDPEIARLAALNITPEYAKRLTEAYEVENTPGASDIEVIERGGAMLYILAEMCGNRFLQFIVDLVVSVSKAVMEAVKPDRSLVHPADAHRPILEAVLAGNAEEAARAMRKHAIEVGEQFIKITDAYGTRANKVGN